MLECKSFCAVVGNFFCAQMRKFAKKINLKKLVGQVCNVLCAVVGKGLCAVVGDVLCAVVGKGLCAVVRKNWWGKCVRKSEFF